MSHASLPNLLLRQAPARATGVAVGLVTNNQDPDGMGRVKVKYPWLGDDDESYWARIVAPMTGKDRGVYFLPEVDDEVLVAFEQGAMDQAYVLGGLWNGKDKPPESNSDGKNNLRTIKSRSGHIIRLDDTDGSEKIEIIDKTGKNKITISAADNSMALEASGDISLKATGKLKLSGNGIEITSQAGVKVEGSQNVELTASAQVNIKGSLVNLN